MLHYNASLMPVMFRVQGALSAHMGRHLQALFSRTSMHPNCSPGLGLARKQQGWSASCPSLTSLSSCTPAMPADTPPLGPPSPASSIRSCMCDFSPPAHASPHKLPPAPFPPAHHLPPFFCHTHTHTCPHTHTHPPANSCAYTRVQGTPTPGTARPP